MWGRRERLTAKQQTSTDTGQSSQVRRCGTKRMAGEGAAGTGHTKCTPGGSSSARRWQRAGAGPCAEERAPGQLGVRKGLRWEGLGQGQNRSGLPGALRTDRLRLPRGERTVSTGGDEQTQAQGPKSRPPGSSKDDAEKQARLRRVPGREQAHRLHWPARKATAQKGDWSP